MSSKLYNFVDLSPEDNQSIVKSLTAGQIGVIPTDTLYGIVGSALNSQTVNQIYTLRKRTPTKPMIILISDIEQIKDFEIGIDQKTRAFLDKIWPNPVSVILPCPESKFEYLHRGTNTLAFRFPDNQFLQGIIAKSGPLVAPSANFEGQPPALIIADAQKYFGDNVDFYLDGGKLESQPSTVIEISERNIKIIRQGAFDITTIPA